MANLLNEAEVSRNAGKAASSSVSKDFRKYEYATTSVTNLKFKDGPVGKVASCVDCLQPYYFHTHLVGRAVIILPMHPFLDEETQDRIVAKLAKAASD